MVGHCSLIFFCPLFTSSSTVNQLPRQSTRIRTRTTLPLLRQRLPLLLTKVVTPLVVVLALVALLAAQAIGAPRFEVRDVRRRLPGARLMRQLYVC
jgi:hypothetical protein